jgi:hypothetical protein
MDIDAASQEWERIRSFPVRERNKVMQGVYNGLDDDTRCIVDDLIFKLIQTVKEKSHTVRFSKSMAREIIFNVVLFAMVREERGDNLLDCGDNHELH